MAMGLSALVVLSGAFAAGYGLLWLTERAVGQLPDLASHVASAILGLVLISVAFGIASRIAHAKGRSIGHMAQEILDALARIATGDFSVRISLREGNPLHEVILSVNKMAEDLGTLEGQRQDFISNVSHEIQSPLTSLSGFAVLLRDEGLSTEERHHYLGIIETESKRLSKLSDNLLKLTALEQEGLRERGVVDVSEQIRSAALMLEPQWAGKGLVLDLVLDDTSCFGDADLLQQVWINLLHNAVKYSHEGGTVTVSARTVAGEAVVEVSDCGIGIDAKDLPHVFERFFKADKSRDRSLGGNGLGLALVKRIVELHGGRVAAMSEPGVGTSVSVCLPIAASGAAR
jgi:signal transduction histidine kinase